MRIRAHRNHGLSLLEVMLVVATIVLMATTLLPLFARPCHRPHRIVCTSNLKQVGLSFRLWANDNADQFPQVSTNSNSSLAWADSPQVFRHFQVMSNEVVTPKVLVCSLDSSRTKAPDFINFSNSNLSYFVGLNADESKPQRLLSGDRNITGGALSNGFLRTIPSTAPAGWTTSIHNRVGNIGLADGSVQQVTEVSLQRQLQAGDLSDIRLAIP